MNDLREALRQVMIARGDVLRFESERLGTLRRLSERLGYPRDVEWTATELIQRAQADAAFGILTGDPDEELLAALQEVYTVGARLHAAEAEERAAVSRLRSAILRMPNPPRPEEVQTREQCEVIAERLVCQEWLAHRPTVPKREP